MKRIIYIIAITFLGSALFTTSCNYLNVDDYFDDTLSLDSVFSNKNNMERYMWGIAYDFPPEDQLFREPIFPGPLGSDEMCAANPLNDYNGGTKFVLGEVTADNIGGNTNSIKNFNSWGRYYKIIRRTNILFSRMDEPADLRPADKIYFLGYTHFMRAYAYYNLLMNYGPVILMGEEIMENNETAMYYDKYRATYDESVDYICAEFERAAEYLPEVIPSTVFGRPTRGAAYAMIARIKLHHASPSFNGGAPARMYFGDWKRSVDGVNYISQTYDEEKWAFAAAAAKRVIDMGLYELHTVPRIADSWEVPDNVSQDDFPNGAGNIDVYRSYSDIFTGETIGSRNMEYVWGKNSSIGGNGLTDYIIYSFSKVELSGVNTASVTQKVVDAHYMADGRDRNNSSAEYPYSEEYVLSKDPKVFSGYTLNRGVHSMYLNREARFYANIGYSQRFWPCASTTESKYKNKTISYEYGSQSGKGAANTVNDDYPISGYVLTKYIHTDDACTGTASSKVPKSFGIYRFAEALLSYAEALNNLTQTHNIELDGGFSYSLSRDKEEIRKYFNQIRYRSGQPGLTDEELNDPKKIQEIIERERMIEFFAEGRRFHDIRRWGYYVDIEKQQLQGMNIDGAGENFYQRVNINHKFARNRVSDKKLMFLPLKKTEVRKSPSLDQNPGYGN